MIHFVMHLLAILDNFIYTLNFTIFFKYSTLIVICSLSKLFTELTLHLSKWGWGPVIFLVFENSHGFGIFKVHELRPPLFSFFLIIYPKLINDKSRLQLRIIQWLGHWLLVKWVGVQFPNRPAHSQINFSGLNGWWFIGIMLVLNRQPGFISFLI